MSPRNSKTGVKWLWRHRNTLTYNHPAYLKANGKPYRFPAGTPLSEAKDMAQQANIENDGHKKIITGQHNNFTHLIKRYREEYLPTKGLAERTLTNIEYRLKRFETDCKNWVTKNVTVRQIADYLDEEFVNDSYIKHRSTLVDLFTFAITKGLHENNPAASTLPRSLKKHESKRRQRLSLEQFKVIRVFAPTWLQNAMDLSLITLQARNEVVNLWFDDIRDGHLHVIRQKTKKHGDRAFIKIEITSELEAIVSRCRDDIISPYIIHRNPEKRYRGTKSHWTQVLPDLLSKEFKKARDLSGLFDDLDAAQRPTFHEIRSLGSDLYLKAGFDKQYINLLLGHTKMKMTEHYLEGHGERWTEAKAELKI